MLEKFVECFYNNKITFVGFATKFSNLGPIECILKRNFRNEWKKKCGIFFFDDQINDPGTISGKVMKFHEAAISCCSWEVVAWAETLSPPLPLPPDGKWSKIFSCKKYFNWR